MPRSKDATVWNEKLKKALQAREDVARRQGKKQALLWNEGWRAIEAVRGDIYTFSTGRIVNLPMFKKKTLDNLCRAIIAGTEPVLPAGYIAHEPGAVIQGNPYQNDPYLNSIKKRGGAFAILMAFYVSPANQVLTKQQICETGQSFCDTEMEENYFAGRSRGAWAAVKTLASHGLVTVHKAVVGYNARAGGLRSHGPSTYTLTQNGTLFTEALLQKNPDIQQQVQAVRGRSTVTPSSYPLTATWSGSNAHTMADPATARNIFADLPDSAIQRPVAEGIAGVDEQELREWLEKALPGHQKEFNVGKDRRKRLRDLCDELNRTALNGTGMQLHHESDGYTKSRELFVTLQQRPHRKIFGDYDDKSVAFETLSSRQDSFPIKSSPPRPRVGHTVLDHESPAKRRLMVPAWVAAANAALERQAIHESLLSATATTVKSSKPKLQQRPPQVTPLQLPKLIDLLDDDSDEGDRKMPANPYKYPIVLELDAETSDSESDDDIPESVLRKKETTAKRDHRSSNSSKGLMMKHSMDEPVDLTESQESQEIVVMENYKVQVKSSQCAIAAKRGQSSRNGWIMDKKDDPYDLTESRESQEIVGIEIAKAAPPQYALVIYIDDRERNRNRSPRTLRLELTRLLSTGLLSMVWPQSLPNATVEEHRLEIGDFAFGALPSSRSDSEIVLPVSVERKRIGDLVQRSYRKDHWYQLHRMQEEAVRNEGVCVLLLEGDSRTAAQYAPSGAQEVETISPFDHTIDDEDSLFRFMGRVILNEATLSKPDQGLQSIRFSQTKDEQGSLRAVGALGLMSITSKQLKSTVRRVKRIDVKAERDCLTNRLKMGGIPWELASRIGDEIRSVKQMSLLYASVEDTDCRDRLLVPLVADLCSVVKLGGTASGWSAAIHRVWFSALPDPTLANERFDQLRHLVEDHALLLDKLHSGLLPDPALDALLASQQLLDTELARTVSIELPAEHSDCFPSESEQQRSFFRLKVLDKPQIFPCIVMQTCAGPYFSSRLCLFLLEGADFVSRLQETFSGDAECVAVARKVSLKLKQDFGAVTSNDDATVLLIRGLDCALDKAAKKNGFRGETRVLADMVQAELMITHKTIVLHAVRLSGDREKIIQQLALSCFHFHLLTYKQNR